MPQKISEKLIHALLFCCAGVSVAATFGIVVVLAIESLLFFKQVPVSELLFSTQWTPQFAEKHFGIAPLMCGTLVTSTVALLVAVPVGLIMAIYLSEFASQRLRSWLKPMLEILAGIPTIVYGYFALVFITPGLQQLIPWLPTFNALSAGLAMGIMILPLFTSMSEDALYSLPCHLRDASFALGSTRMQMVFRVLVPSAMGGIVAAFILSLSRAVGETMIVAIAAGQQPNLSLDPTKPIQTMTAYIVQISLGDTPHGTLEYHTIFVVGGMLFLITLIMNFASLRIREKFRSAYL
jgi:phosphate transport system permease protein